MLFDISTTLIFYGYKINNFTIKTHSLCFVLFLIKTVDSTKKNVDIYNQSW